MAMHPGTEARLRLKEIDDQQAFWRSRLAINFMRWRRRLELWCLWAFLRVWALFRPKALIDDGNGFPLITRWFLTSRPLGGKTGVPGWYLHRFEGADPCREEHNHPWTYATTYILRGGYVELRDGKPHVRRAGERAEIGPDDYHRIVAVAPGTWTLFHSGPKHGRGWGFREARP